MNKRVRNKIENRKLAELRAKELGIDLEKMSDDEISLLAEDYEKKENNISQFLLEEEIALAQAESIGTKAEKEERAKKELSNKEKSKLVSIVSSVSTVNHEDSDLDVESLVIKDAVHSSSLDDEDIDKERVAIGIQAFKDAINKENKMIDSLFPGFQEREKEGNKANNSKIGHLEVNNTLLNSSDINKSIDTSFSDNQDIFIINLQKELEEKKEKFFEDIKREDIRFETQNKYIKEVLKNDVNNSKNDKKFYISKSILKSVLKSNKPVLVRKNDLKKSRENIETTKGVKDMAKEKNPVINPNLENNNKSLEVEKYVKSAIEEVDAEMKNEMQNKNCKKEKNAEESGIKIIKDNGINYISINGEIIDKQENFVEALGLNMEHQNINKESTNVVIDKDDEEDVSQIESTEGSIRKEIEKKSRKKKRKLIFTWIIILILIGGVSYIYNFFNTNRRLPWTPESAIAKDVKTYTDIKVMEEESSPIVNINGVLKANDLQDVVLRSSGAIKTINVEEGDVVKKGDILVTVDDSSEQYNIANIESQIKNAKLNGNLNDVKLLELQLENAKNSLEYTTAVANFDGVVAKQEWEVGDYNSLSTTNNNSMVIADLSKFKATVQIDELDIGYVTVGQKAELSFDSLPGVVIEAEVSSIPMLGRYSSQGFGVLDVEITIPNPPKNLKTGFTFSGKILSDRKESIIVVNQASVYPVGDKQYVKQRMSDGSFKEVAVTIRYLGENKVQILSGDIKAGDTVVIENQPTVDEQIRVML